ncbi:MAG TPA: hypothetical protein VM489_01310 [Burkholderiales bacterium]|nr:hypothetical protein [Burkholderiales bacterium]
MISLAARPAASKKLRNQSLTPFQAAVLAILAVAALAVVVASLRISESAITREVERREAAGRFLAEELVSLRITAMTATSGVPARLYLGIEECFKARAPVPFAGAEPAAVRQIVASCAEMELGRLHAQGGAARAEHGRSVLRQTGILR